MSFDAGDRAPRSSRALAAVLLALLPGYQLSAYAQCPARPSSPSSPRLSLLFVERPAPGAYLLVDDLNIVFIVLTTFVGFTTSVFSASYIAHELETGRLTPTFLRFYHALYQVLMFAHESRAAQPTISA